MTEWSHQQMDDWSYMETKKERKQKGKMKLVPKYHAIGPDGELYYAGDMPDEQDPKFDHVYSSRRAEEPAPEEPVHTSVESPVDHSKPVHSAYATRDIMRVEGAGDESRYLGW
jgi:hypothetical protein